MDLAVYAAFVHDHYEPLAEFYENRDDAMAYAEDTGNWSRKTVQVLRIPLADPAETAKILAIISTTTHDVDRLMPYAIHTIEGTY